MNRKACHHTWEVSGESGHGNDSCKTVILEIGGEFLDTYRVAMSRNNEGFVFHTEFSKGAFGYLGYREIRL